MTDTTANILAQARTFSLYADRLLSAKPTLAGDLLAFGNQSCTAAAIENALAHEFTDPAALSIALRELRQRVMLHTMARDLAGLADLQEVCATMTALADTTIRTALAHHHRWLAQQFGEPLGAVSGTPQNLIVVGMGKLGGGELNVSSDVDLVFLYPEQGDTSGPRQISNHEFFDQLGRHLVAAIDEATREGFVFRVDTRLRPYGESGPFTSSLAMLEQYLITQGRAWERYAWLKARVVAGGMHEAVNALVQPFVFRKYLDYDAYASLRDLHRQISEQVRRRDLNDDIKLGPGGIREIEFIVQVFQLIRGGREPWLRERATMPMFGCLAEHGLLSLEAATQLSKAYVFLRRLEHRLQYRDDRQTHTLPGAGIELELTARATGFSGRQEFLDELTRHRDNVGRHFADAFGDYAAPDSRHPLATLWDSLAQNTDNTAALSALGYRDPNNLLQRLRAMRTSNRYEELPALSKDRFDALMPVMLQLAAQYSNADQTCARLLNLLEAVSRRSAYLALLAEHPPLVPRVAQMMSASSWAAEYLTKHPLLLDELLDVRLPFAVPDYAEWKRRLAADLQVHAGDTERQMDVLRHFKHSQTFRLLAQDLEGTLPVTKLSDHLSMLADLILDATLATVWAQLAPGAPPPPFALIAYGKLGGKELGYASDLDLIFLHHDDNDEASVRYVRLAQRIIAWLNSTTAAGQLYEVDVRLRPDGESGLLISRFDAFCSYQRHQAWEWEHQALTRARFCAGDSDLGARFEAERVAILRLPRAPKALCREILGMRAKMHDAHPGAPGMFDLKHDEGGMIDIEFIVQFLVLGHSHRYAQLTANRGNIALLNMAAELALIDPALAAATAEAYRCYRLRQHVLRLNGMARAQVNSDDYAEEGVAVRSLWRKVFG